jgi:putative radical SAM enzyme (TIGR03279 family)
MGPKPPEGTPPKAVEEQPRGIGVIRVDAASIAHRVGIRPGDRLLTLNGNPVEDVIDLWFHGAAERLRISWLPAGSERPIAKTVRKAFHERLGIEAEPFEIRRCTNYCVFCFVHQLPPGMRRELYIKDEDYRLSFLYGNYITGTNLSPTDLARITKLKLSPLYFSIHATDQKVREDLLAKKGIAPIMPLLRDLTAKGIFVHAQIVLCPGINDGKVLAQTVSDLASLHPRLESVAVVPVGLTDHRKRLPGLRRVTPEYAREFLAECARLQARTRRKVGYPVVFPSDEFFLIAGLDPPSYSEYPEIPQLANGVGMCYRFYENIEEITAALPAALPEPRRVAAITTSMGVKVLGRLAALMNTQVSGLTIDLLPATNTLFGEGITVSGLLPGCDFLRTIRENGGYDRYLVPENALRPWDRRFLDDMTLEELGWQADAEVVAGGETAESFAGAVLGPGSRQTDNLG